MTIAPEQCFWFTRQLTRCRKARTHGPWCAIHRRRAPILVTSVVLLPFATGLLVNAAWDALSANRLQIVDFAPRSSPQSMNKQLQRAMRIDAPSSTDMLVDITTDILRGHPPPAQGVADIIVEETMTLCAEAEGESRFVDTRVNGRYAAGRDQLPTLYIELGAFTEDLRITSQSDNGLTYSHAIDTGHPGASPRTFRFMKITGSKSPLPDSAFDMALSYRQHLDYRWPTMIWYVSPDFYGQDVLQRVSAVIVADRLFSGAKRIWQIEPDKADSSKVALRFYDPNDADAPVRVRIVNGSVARITSTRPVTGGIAIELGFQ